MLDLKSELNEQQYDAAAHVHGPLLVIAGAGSGKTRVITYRIANLVQAHGVRPYRILAVTFTNKAAKEMKERISRLLGSQAGDEVWVSTFHATCAKLLRLHGAIIGVDPKFTIYDDSDQKAMVARCLKDLKMDDKQFPPRALQNEINNSKQELVSAEDYPASDYYRERFKQLFLLYEKKMKQASALDFGDLLYRVVKGMRQNAEFAQAITRRFDYILVDEFQDTNKVQLELVRMLAAPHGNICVVGDDDQSIYSWRGADITNILDFERFFPGARCVTLDRNYRSTGNILKASHAVVCRLAGRRDKTLWTTSDAGDRLFYVEAPDEREEARLVARAVREMQSEGHSLKEQAVFYRINAQSRVFEEVFRTMGIPHRVVGGMRFYERAEVKDLLAFLRLIQNPGDLAAFMRIVNVPARGIGKTTVDRLLALAAGHGVSAYEAIDLAAEHLGAGPTKKLAEFKKMVSRWRTEIDEGPSHLATRVLDDTGYVTGLKNENTAEADARLENLEELVGSIQDFEGEAEDPSLNTFLELVALQTDVDQANFDDEQVTLMTVHAAKGLEFDVVHVTGLEETLFPYRRGGGDMLDESPEEMDEERRLCYVAMTRARKRLFLHRARSRKIFGQSKINRPSRFLSDVDPDLVYDCTPDRARPQLLSPPVAPSPRSWSDRAARATAMASRNRAAAPARTAAASPRRPARPDSSPEMWIDRSFDQTTEAALHPGQKVRHAKFGIGEVVSVAAGAKPKIDVRFPGFGTKTIMADFLELG